MPKKPIKLTETQARILRFAAVFKSGVNKHMMENFGHRVGTYEALHQRGLMSRPPLGAMPYTVTAEGHLWIANNPVKEAAHAEP